MPKVKQTKAELIAHLKDAVWFLQASGAAFDAGHLAEAKRLAVSIRVLVHDTSQSKSLLGQLGWQAGRSFLNSALPYDATNLINHHGLVAIKMEPGTGASYCAPLGEG